MQDNMQDQANPYQQAGGQQYGGQSTKQQPTQSRNTVGEYIDFEEVK
jgi:hypothetical protein